MNVSELIDAALEARQMSYAPYSHFAVGAALLTEDERVFKGCNVENAALSPTVCAERAAFFNAIAAGCRDFTAIAIVGGKAGEDINKAYTFPCGTCRQVMCEFCAGSFEIIVAKSRDDYAVYTLKELLPHSFGPVDLD